MGKEINVVYSSTKETTIQEVIQELIKVHTVGAKKYSQSNNENTTKDCR